MNRRVLPIAFLAALITVPSASATPLHQAPRPVNLISIHMVTPDTGWGATRTAFLHTNDGGHSWQDVTPSGLRGRGSPIGDMSGFDPVDANTAWLAVPRPLNPEARSAVVRLFRTVDAGQTWQTVGAPHVGPSGVSQLQFANGNNGWMVLTGDAGMMHLSIAIYRTVDGGRHWWVTLRVKAWSQSYGRPTGSGIIPCNCSQSFTFVAPAQGWAGACYACLFSPSKSELLHSTDGGHRWYGHPLPLPRGYRPNRDAAAAPIFFTSSSAVLPVYLFGAHGGFRFDAFHTADGGRTWRGTARINVQTMSDPVSFVDPEHGFVLTGHTLYRTVNGGQSWQALHTRLSRDTLMQLEFVTPSTGFAIEGVGASNRTRLLETTNGGVTWEFVGS